MKEKRRAWCIISEDALVHNKEVLEEKAGCPLMAVVKADAYGHGLSETAELLEKHGVQWFCTATLDEAIALRKGGIQGNILILGKTDPWLIHELVKYDLVQTVVDADYARALNTWGVVVKCHLAIDTGMHRIGIPHDDEETIQEVLNLPYLDVSGIFSHLCVSASKKEEDIAFTKLQIERFNAICRGKHLFRHLLASYGVARYGAHVYDGVRCGIALYGCGESTEEELGLPLERVMTLQCRMMTVRSLSRGESIGYGLAFTADKDMLVADLSIGYGDGLIRNMTEKGYVLVHGKRAKIIGRMCMDQMFVDVTGMDCHPDDVVTIIGKDGEEEITAEEAAGWSGTIANELLSGLSARLERIYV